MKLRIFITALITGIALAFPFAGHAEDLPSTSEMKATVQEDALNFARCSGIYAAVSEIHAATDAPALAKNTKEQSNGALIASAYILSSTGIIPDWKNANTYAENTASSTKLSYLASFEKQDANKAISELTDAMKECNKRLELQEKLIQEVRLKVYSQNPQ